MADYYGNITLGDTLDLQFTTEDPTGAPITLAGSPIVSAYIGNSTTEITAGITLTVDFDGRTGFHNVHVVATSGNGFTTATNVGLLMTGGTVSTITVTRMLGAFSIGARTVTSVASGVTIASGGIIAGAHAAAELNALADALLDRNMATGTDSGTDSTVVRTVRQALRRLRNKEAIVTGTGTTYKEDDSTPSWTYAATATAGNPLSAVDPT